MNNAILGLGSNVNPRRNIHQALIMLRQRYTLLAQADWLWTQPVQVRRPQPPFINTGCLIVTQQSRMVLTRQLKKIETALKRLPHSRDLPRTIDIDVLVWNGNPVDPDIQLRDFLMIIIAQLKPQLNLLYHRKLNATRIRRGHY